LIGGYDQPLTAVGYLKIKFLFILNQKKNTYFFSNFFLELFFLVEFFFRKQKIMRSIKRTRQIEDLVIEKLGKRGYISSRETEQSADFVKNLILDESIDMMTKIRE